jgi:hypothetical protein
MKSYSKNEYAQGEKWRCIALEGVSNTGSIQSTIMAIGYIDYA